MLNSVSQVKNSFSKIRMKRKVKTHILILALSKLSSVYMRALGYSSPEGEVECV